VDIPKRAKLTNKLCRSLPSPHAGQYAVRDTDQPGFMLVVGKRSSTYTVQTDVVRLGKRETVKRAIGAAEDWDATAARQEAQRIIVGLRTEKTKHTSRRNALTFGEAWGDYKRRLEARVAAGERSQRTLDAYADYAERLLADWLATPLREIGEAPHLVADRHRQLSDNHGRYQANRAMEVVRAIYSAAVKRRLDPGLPPVAPTSAIDWNSEERRNSGMDAGQLKAWAKQLAAMPNPVRREFHLFCLLSAMRPDALSKARWEHLDIKRRALRVPSPKGGKRRAFDLPLSREMLHCLWRARKAGRVLHSNAAREWIFPAATPTGHLAEHRERRTVLSAWGNDLRQTYRGMAVAAGVDELSIRLLMNHALKDVSEGYLTVAAIREHLRAQQNRVSAYILAAMKGRQNEL
jgi:integrase